jgi:crossover junction endodeoxyribonuclease RusA
MFRLPYPPSVNHYWQRNRNGSMRIGAEGLAYRKEVFVACHNARVRKMKGRLYIEVIACPPDARRRDLDNLWKAILDALQHVGVIEDDNQFDRLEIRRGVIEKHGLLAVEIGYI